MAKHQTTWTSEKRLYLTKAGKVVGPKHPDRRTVLVAAGGKLPMAQAIALGLAKPAPEPKAAAKPADKAMPRPANKGVAAARARDAAAASASVDRAGVDRAGVDRAGVVEGPESEDG